MNIFDFADTHEISRYGETMVAKKLSNGEYRIEFFNKNHQRYAAYTLKTVQGYAQVLNVINKGAWNGPWIAECRFM